VFNSRYFREDAAIITVTRRKTTVFFRAKPLFLHAFNATRFQSRFYPTYIYRVLQILLKPQMNKILFTALIAALCCINVHAQDVIRQQSCEDGFINKQVDSLKALYSKDGYSLLKEASISMESEYEMPVIVPLTQGSWYQFVFIGDYSSKLYEVRMFDWNEKQVVYQQKRWGDVDGNIISYSYMPKFSEFHMMKPVQVNKKKKKNLCGYVMLFRKGPEDGNASVGTR
jgi:hypothetical protein